MSVTPPPAALDRVARVEVRLDPVLTLGPVPHGLRRVVPITGGRIDGDRLRGEILHGGADWQLVHDDGGITIDTRYTARTHDGALIYLATRGVRHGPPAVLDRLLSGEEVDPAEYYFRLGVCLETGDERYAWLNRTVFVASAARGPDTVVYDLYALT
nr:DUF3237 domain-containing protein [Saccharomonospora saliphila]